MICTCRSKVLSEVDKAINSGVDADNDTFVLVAASIYLLEEVRVGLFWYGHATLSLFLPPPSSLPPSLSLSLSLLIEFWFSSSVS